jgi:hypothetical protein
MDESQTDSKLSVRNAFQVTQGIAIGIFFVVLIFLALDYFGTISIASFFSKKQVKTSNAISNDNIGFILEKKQLPIGYSSVSVDNSQFRLIALITKVYVSSNVIYADINYKNTLGKTVNRKIVIFNKNRKYADKFFLTEQSTYDFFPETKAYKTEVITNQDVLLKKLGQFLQKPIVLQILLKDKRSSLIEDYILCNNSWYSKINLDDDLSCPPFANEIYVFKN